MLGVVLVLAFLFIFAKFSSVIDNQFTAERLAKSLEKPGDSSENIWDKIEPSTQLNYVDCFQSFQCARLSVPVDWKKSIDNSTNRVVLAIIKLPARVPIWDPRYGGAVFLNPGGPGVSAVGDVLRYGNSTQRIVDSLIDPKSTNLDARYFDIIGVDARGINNTTPKFKCFSDKAARSQWPLVQDQMVIPSESDGAFEKVWATNVALTKTCASTLDNSESMRLAEHMNTLPNIWDMVEIIERLGEWREITIKALLLNPIQRFKIKYETYSHELDEKALIDRTSWKKGQEKLLLIGYSYGTFFGSLFASMYPERVGRFVLDGVTDPLPLSNQSYSGIRDAMTDSDKIIEMFSVYCAQAGETECPLAISQNPKEISNYFEEIVNDLLVNPLPVPASAGRYPDVISYTDVMKLIRITMYSPSDNFGPLSELLSGVSRKDGRLWADYKQNKVLFRDGNIIPNPEGVGPDYGEHFWEVAAATYCTDNQFPSNRSRSSYQEFLRQSISKSKWSGAYSATLVWMPCFSWSIRPKHYFSGPVLRHSGNPILFVSNTYDPITPIKFGRKMSEHFNGSVLLQQNSAGHCSYSAPSSCTHAHVRGYFESGALPPKDTVCQPDKLPFNLQNAPDLTSLEMGQADHHGDQWPVGVQ